MNTALIHLFSVYDKFYMYDTNKNSILQLEKDVYKILAETEGDLAILEENYLDYSIIRKLINLGFLSSNKVKEICHPQNDIIQYNLSRKLWTIALQVTQQCNLRCSYCVYSGSYNNRNHSNKKMSLKTAIKSIDFLISNSIDNRMIAVGFYGGEPLLEFDLIKKCIIYTEEKAEGKDILFTITSNSTLINDEIIEFFNEHNVSLVISLDGPAQIHNKNRKYASDGHGSFYNVMENIEKIKIKYPAYYKNISISTVLDPKNDFICTSEFFANTDALKELMMNVSQISNEYSIKDIEFNDNFYTKVKYEYFKLFLSKLGRLDEKYTSKLVRDHYFETKRIYEGLKASECLAEKMHPSGPCIPGITRMFVNTDGFIFPCERVSENSEAMRIGHVDIGFDMIKVKKLLNIGQLTEEKCKNCWAIRFCSLCARSADSLIELSAEKRLSRCDNVRKTVENNLKDICVLKEKGIDFNNDIILYLS